MGRRLCNDKYENHGGIGGWHGERTEVNCQQLRESPPRAGLWPRPALCPHEHGRKVRVMGRNEPTRRTIWRMSLVSVLGRRLDESIL